MGDLLLGTAPVPERSEERTVPEPEARTAQQVRPGAVAIRAGLAVWASRNPTANPQGMALGVRIRALLFFAPYGYGVRPVRSSPEPGWREAYCLDPHAGVARQSPQRR